MPHHDSTNFAPGDEVELVGFKASALNGRRGRVVSAALYSFGLRQHTSRVEILPERLEGVVYFRVVFNWACSRSSRPMKYLDMH